MLRIACLLSSLLIIHLSLPSVSSSKEQLAVMDLKADYGVEQGLAKALSVKIRDAIHSFGDYEVLSKKDLEALAERTETQLLLGGKCADAICLIDLGKKLGTKYMVYGSISKLGDTCSISLRLLDTKGKDAGVKKRVNKEYKCSEGGIVNTVNTVVALVMGEKLTSKKETTPPLSTKKALDSIYKTHSISVGVKDFSASHSPENNILRVQFLINNLSTTPGYIFVVLKPDNSNQDSWLVIPSVNLTSGIPSDIKRGKFFKICRYKSVHLMATKQTEPEKFILATIFVFTRTGELVLEKDIPVSIKRSR